MYPSNYSFDRLPRMVVLKTTDIYIIGKKNNCQGCLPLTKTQATSDMSCCKCNRSGRCRNCSCVKSGRICQGCLPQRLGHCTNATVPLQRSSSETSTASTVDEAPPEVILSHSSDEDEVSRPSIDVTLPSPALQPPKFTWGSCSGEVFCMNINLAYEEVVHWRRNLFQVPSGSVGKSFVFRAGSSLSSLCRHLKSGMHSYESYHHDANPPPPKAKPYK